MKRLPFLLALGLVACGYSQDKFEDEFADAVCNKYDECGWLETLGMTLDECLNPDVSDTAGGEEVECVNYDSAAAKECVTAWEELTCEQLDAFEFPTICNDVCEVETGDDTGA